MPAGPMSLWDYTPPDMRASPIVAPGGDKADDLAVTSVRNLNVTYWFGRTLPSTPTCLLSTPRAMFTPSKIWCR